METKRDYKYIDSDETCLTLHDCYANHIDVEAGKLTFDLEDGFWVTPAHQCNDLNKIVRTDRSRVEFYFDPELMIDLNVFVFQKNIFGETVRKQWKLEKLVNFVNEQKGKLEFIDCYKTSNESLYECRLHFHRSPYIYECQIRIPAFKPIYMWNNLCADREW